MNILNIYPYFLVIIILIILFIYVCIYKKGEYFSGALGFLIGCVLIGIIIESYPKAIDVYRGGTELIINKELQNDEVIKIDSTVVWKKKKNI